MWFSQLTPSSSLSSLASDLSSSASATRTQLTVAPAPTFATSIIRRISFTPILPTVVTASAATSQQAYTSSGTYTWVCPAGVLVVHVVCVGGGGGGYNGSFSYSAGSGGGLGWKNNISVTPGQSYTVVVGAGGPDNSSVGNRYFISTGTLCGYGGGCATAGASTGGPNANNHGGGYFGDGGGAGGNNSNHGGGGGAAGYTGNGGNGASSPGTGSGGGATGGSHHSSFLGSGAGGGVGILGQGTNGGANWCNSGHPSGGDGTYSHGGGGRGGSGGTYGMWGQSPYGNGQSSTNIAGGIYGGGGGGAGDGWPSSAGVGGVGAVRIIWNGGTTIVTSPGNTSTWDESTLPPVISQSGGVSRTWPSTNTADY